VRGILAPGRHQRTDHERPPRDVAPARSGAGPGASAPRGRRRSRRGSRGWPRPTSSRACARAPDPPLPRAPPRRAGAWRPRRAPAP
jgi:hypothetical protein